MRSSSKHVFAFLAAGMVALAAYPASAGHPDYHADVTLTYLGIVGGQQRYRLDYEVENLQITPKIGEFHVFFNSSPESPFPPSGDRATFVSVASPAGWDAEVYDKNADGQWSVEWIRFLGEAAIPPGQKLGGFSVVLDWNDPTTVPGTQHAQARNGQSVDASTEIVEVVGVLGTVRGIVRGTCGASTAPLHGVIVDLFRVVDGVDVFVATTATNASGAYAFADVVPGAYHLTLVTPLGYTTTPETQLVVAVGDEVTVDMLSTCRVIPSAPRTIGYWKHQVNVHLAGKGSAQESLSQLVGYIDLIVQRFNHNVVNPVIVYVPGIDTGDNLRRLEQLLTVNRGATMLDRAKQQVLSLLLNVVALKIAQTDVISPNGATVSQAITHANDLIQDGDPANDERAKDIADYINNGKVVPSGWVPAATRMITYSRRPAAEESLELRLNPPFPNPARGAVAITFALPAAGEVELAVFDVGGRRVRVLASGDHAAGPHQVSWDGADETGGRLAAGVYFSRLSTIQGVVSRSIIIER